MSGEAGRTALARAGTNIALVKYWGKRDRAANLPATGSLSMTLSGMTTTTRVTFDPSLAADELILDGKRARDGELARVARLLDRVRALGGEAGFARVESQNDFPTAAGLASSASGFAALAVAAVRAAGVDGGLPLLSSLARQGSGSAPRSLLGGFVELRPGERDDGADCLPVAVAPADAWDLRLVVAVNGVARKDVGSTEGMERTRLTSPCYPAWVGRSAGDLARARAAIAARDLPALGAVAEASCFTMHASALAADPPLLYWSGVTVDVVRRVWDLRRDGLPGWVTIDAGPHVKVLCAPGDAARIAAELAGVPGVTEVRVESPGPGAAVAE